VQRGTVVQSCGVPLLNYGMRLCSIMFTLFQQKEESAVAQRAPEQTSMLLETMLTHVPSGCQ
jgi:hypothetical protein